MEDVLTFVVKYIGKAFVQMQNFPIIAGLSLFDLFVILLVLDVVITIFVPTIGDLHGDLVASSRRNQAAAERSARKRSKDK